MYESSTANPGNPLEKSPFAKLLRYHFISKIKKKFFYTLYDKQNKDYKFNFAFTLFPETTNNISLKKIPKFSYFFDHLL